MSLFSNLFGGEFGKGLVAGTAKGLEKGFADDIERTKNNVDNLVLESYKGAVESKKEFDRVYKENRKIVDQIIANLGGEQGADNKDAIYAAQGLIADQGLDGALKYSDNLSSQFKLYGRDPIKSLQMAKKVNHSTPLSADLLTKSTVPAITIPDFQDLTKGADVGIMRFFGDKDYTPNLIETRAKNLMRARGIDPNKGDLNLPPAVAIKIDPLIAGMQTNPVNEVIRLQNFLADNKDMSSETEARVKNMINVQQNIINRQNKLKTQRVPGPFNEAEAKDYMKFITDQIVTAFDINVKRNDFTGAYVSIGDKNKKNKLVMDYVNKIMITLNDAAKKGTLTKQGNFMTIVSQAILANKKLVDVNGVLTTVDDDVIFNQTDFDTLKKKTTSQLTPPGSGNLSTMSQSQLVSSIKSLQPNTPKRTKAMDALVKLIIKNRKAQGAPVSYNDAMNIAKNLIK
jgi:hypothetical protein